MCVEMNRTSAVALGSLWSSPDLFLQVSSVSVLCSPGAVGLAARTRPGVGSPGKAFCAVCGAGEAAVCNFAVAGRSGVQSIPESLLCPLRPHAESGAELWM